MWPFKLCPRADILRQFQDFGGSISPESWRVHQIIRNKEVLRVQNQMSSFCLPRNKGTTKINAWCPVESKNAWANTLQCQKTHTQTTSTIRQHLGRKCTNALQTLSKRETCKYTNDAKSKTQNAEYSVATTKVLQASRGSSLQQLQVYSSPWGSGRWVLGFPSRMDGQHSRRVPGWSGGVRGNGWSLRARQMW